MSDSDYFIIYVIITSIIIYLIIISAPAALESLKPRMCYDGNLIYWPFNGPGTIRAYLSNGSAVSCDGRIGEGFYSPFIRDANTTTNGTFYPGSPSV
jgi:hypothetical protein